MSVERTPSGRRVLIEPIAAEAACPDCGVLSSRIQARPVHRVKDVSCGGELVASLAQAASCELWAVTGLAAAGQVSWTTVMRILGATARVDGDIDRRLVRRLGIDEHRFRTVRYLADETGRIKRVEPWSIVFTDLDTGTILDIVDGRRGATVRRWLAERPRWW
ncbi:transposase [Kocuria palustris]|nr:transposase [Kocuria palustris]MBN6759333.1 transposase [Kocuria palustris]MBN6764359.1 transposase [Kocuria palustris]MBN6783844.1 transposase [Kocuria palustris]MBN6800326.1 transposase [Kocuria palustris]